MWYGMLATTRYGGATRSGRSRSSASPSISCRRPASIGPAKCSCRYAVRLRSSSTAVTVAPASSRPPVRIPSPGPISSTRVPSPAAARSRIASSTSGSARKFWDLAWLARRPSRRSVRRTSSGSRRGPCGAQCHEATRRSSPGERQRRRGLEVEAPPARRRRTGARRRPRSWPRCPCTGRAAARSAARRAPPPRRRAGLAARHWRRPRPRARSNGRPPPEQRGSSWRRARPRPLPGSPRRAPRSRASGSVSAGSRRPASARAASTVRRAAVFNPENEKSNESPSQARGNTASCRLASSAARWMAGPPG